MEEVTKQKGISTGALVTVAVIVTIAFGGGAYAYVSQKAAKEKKALNAQITELQKQSSTSQTATSTASTASTADWKTYTNSDYNYSIKYPSNYYVKDTCGNDEKSNKTYALITKKKLGNDVIDCSSYKGLVEMSVLTIQVESDTSTDFSGGSSSTSLEVIGGQSWKKYIFQYDPNSQLDSSNNSTLLAFTKNGKAYLINWINSDSKGSHDSSIDGILSTFQFTK